MKYSLSFFVILSILYEFTRFKMLSALSISLFASQNRTEYSPSFYFFFFCSYISLFSWSSFWIESQAPQLVCPFQTLRQIQQNQYLHLQVMWMQPPFLSIEVLHIGHCWVTSQLSHWFYFLLTMLLQAFRSGQFRGKWSCSPQKRQIRLPQSHTKMLYIVMLIRMALLQPSLRQSLTLSLLRAKLLQRRLSKAALRSGLLTCPQILCMRRRLVLWKHPSYGHIGNSSQLLRSVWLISRKFFQQLTQKACPQGFLMILPCPQQIGHSPSIDTALQSCSQRIILLPVCYWSMTLLSSSELNSQKLQSMRFHSEGRQVSTHFSQFSWLILSMSCSRGQTLQGFSSETALTRLQSTFSSQQGYSSSQGSSSSAQMQAYSQSDIVTSFGFRISIYMH